jgi:small subunit ribosomal protein S10
MPISRIRLVSTNVRHLEDVCNQIAEISKRTNAQMRGPVPLPTKRIKIPTRKSPDGGGTATWEKWELRIHKRLIDLASNERAMKQIARLQLPEDVQIEIEVPS